MLCGTCFLFGSFFVLLANRCKVSINSPNKFLPNIAKLSTVNGGGSDSLISDKENESPLGEGFCPSAYEKHKIKRSINLNAWLRNVADGESLILKICWFNCICWVNKFPVDDCNKIRRKELLSIIVENVIISFATLKLAGISWIAFFNKLPYRIKTFGRVLGFWVLSCCLPTILTIQCFTGADELRLINCKTSSDKKISYCSNASFSKWPRSVKLPRSIPGAFNLHSSLFLWPNTGLA